MRVRESVPTWDEVKKFYADEDILGVIAHLDGTTVGEVLREYASKVGTWRQAEEVELGRNKVWTPARQLAAMELTFFGYLGARLDGAPDWLRDNMIVYYQQWISEWRAQVALSDNDVAYVRAILNRALKSTSIPRDLP